MRRFRVALAGALIATLALSAPASAVAPRSYDPDLASDGATAPDQQVDKDYALVQLDGEPLATYEKTRPAPGRKIDFAGSTVKSYRAHLSALRNEFKQWLRKVAPKAQVVAEYDLSLNAVAVKLNGTDIAVLRGSPLVLRAQYEGIYRPLEVEDPDLALISAFAGWAAAGRTSADAGAGVKVAIIDSGIDHSHPCFSDDGYPAQTRLGDSRFTNNKVIVAKVFNNKARSRGYTAEAIDSHGTHVAGTVACNFGTPASVDGVDIPFDISGVAPRALLGNYNVFPGLLGEGRSEDILNALEAAYLDGMDIANMSLGGPSFGIQDLLTIAVDNLDRAGMVVAVAAGNSGPGNFTVESPGNAPRALTAGASVVPHVVTSILETARGDVPLDTSEFGSVTSDLTAELAEIQSGAVNAATGLRTGCDPAPAGSLTGKIALISRGVCTFSTKLRNAQAAGAVAAVVVNNQATGLVMGVDGTPDQPTIPAYSTALAYAPVLRDARDTTVTLTAPTYVNPYDVADRMADFSSQGPTDVDFRVKPDVVAPGENVLSAIPRSYCGGDPCFAFFGGTSMATPHLAGAAAILRQQHPTWPAWAIRSAIVNTADVGVVSKWNAPATLDTDVNSTGAGRLNLESAAEAVALLDPVSISFGSVPAGSGQTRTFTATILNGGSSGATFTLAIAGYGPSSGVTFSVDTPSVTLAAGESATFVVTATFAKGASFGSKQAWLAVSEGGSMVAHAAVYALVK